ncbi:MAG: putative 4-hydroxybenzoate polyprenyltransferase [Chitinophagales bacterium]|nr:putative 4-hydroxybenzoate polyprenyltransferase [Chitinophagales bacterium]
MKAKSYLSLIKFSHTLFALPFAIIGGIIGYQNNSELPVHETIQIGFAALGCMVFGRSAAMAFNRYIDRKIDKANPRTITREIPSGIISEKNAVLFILSCIGLFILCAGMINKTCFYLSPIALLVILGYSLTKRFTFLCHFILGLGLSLAPIGAYLAFNPVFSWIPVAYGIGVLCWVSGFDIIYALQDEQFDKSQNLHSVPVKLGTRNSLILSILVHAIVPVSFYFASTLQVRIIPNGLFFWIGYFIFIALLTYQHLIVKPKDLSKVNLAFFTLNGIASVLFAVFFIANYLVHLIF